MNGVTQQCESVAKGGGDEFSSKHAISVRNSVFIPTQIVGDQKKTNRGNHKRPPETISNEQRDD